MSSNLTTTSENTVSKPQDQPTPALLRTPSERDLEVYRRVKIWGHAQYEVAGDLKIHYSRVSQIVKKVHRWIAAGGNPIDPQLRDHAARQSLARATHKLRVLRAIEKATMVMEAEPGPRTTTRIRTVRNVEVWREEILNDVPGFRLPAIRVLLRATELMHKIEQSEVTKTPAEPTDDRLLLPAICDLLCRWRTKAEAAGRLPAASNVGTLVATTLDTLLGTDLGSHHAPRDEPSPTEDPDGTTQDSAQDNLNLSADCAEANSATTVATHTSADSISPVRKTISKLERPAPVAMTTPSSALGQLAAPS